MGLVKLSSGKKTEMPRQLISDLAAKSVEFGLHIDKVSKVLDAYQNNWSVIDIGALRKDLLATLHEMIQIYLEESASYSLSYNWRSIEETLTEISNDIEGE